MKKNLLILFVTFVAHNCLSQHIPPDISFSIIARLDTTGFVTQLNYAVKDNSRILLNWKFKNTIAVDFFTVERSSNGKQFEPIAILKSLSNGQQPEWIDESFLQGKNYYRIRAAGQKGEQFFSRTILVTKGIGNSFKFYPNPVDNILIIRSEVALDVQIADATGKIRIMQSAVQGLQTINVSNLEKGIYVLRLTNRLTNTITQEELIKN